MFSGLRLVDRGAPGEGRVPKPFSAPQPTHPLPQRFVVGDRLAQTLVLGTHTASFSKQRNQLGEPAGPRAVSANHVGTAALTLREIRGRPGCSWKSGPASSRRHRRTDARVQTGPCCPTGGRAGSRRRGSGANMSMGFPSRAEGGGGLGDAVIVLCSFPCCCRRF